MLEPETIRLLEIEKAWMLREIDELEIEINRLNKLKRDIEAVEIIIRTNGEQSYE